MFSLTTPQPHKGALLETFYTETIRAIRHGRELPVVVVDLLDAAAPTTKRALSKTLIDMTTLVRRYDVLGYWGGRTFLCLCPESSSNEARIVAGRFQAEPTVAAAHLASFPDDGRTLDVLVGAARSANPELQMV